MILHRLVGLFALVALVGCPQDTVAPTDTGAPPTDTNQNFPDVVSPPPDTGGGNDSSMTIPENCEPDCPEDQFCNRQTMQCMPRMGEPLCNNTCRWAGDGDCDDKGPMCDTGVCDFGTDCMDCGPRQEAQRPAEGTTTMCPCGGCAAGMSCNRTTGQCEACNCGGRQCGSLPDNSACNCGTCPDGNFCIRETGMCMAEMGSPLCNNTCGTPGDGECDDGGPMCIYSTCEFGSDCADCGMRMESERPMMGMENCSGGGFEPK